MTAPQETQHSRFNNLKIDLEATARFYESSHEGSNPMRMATNDFGEKILLKTSIAFKDDDEKNSIAKLSLDNLRAFVDSFTDTRYSPTFESEYEANLENLFAEEQAARLAKRLGIKMPDAQLVIIDEMPFIAYEYIEGIKDTSMGVGVKISEDLTKRKEQETALAAGALLRLLLKTVDGGQFLQDPDGNVYLSDLGVINLYNSDSQLSFEASLSDFFIPRSEEMLAHQIAGAATPEFAEIEAKLEKLTLDEVIGILARNPNKPTENEIAKAQSIIDRKKFVLELFAEIKKSPKEVFLRILAQRR